jgi:hypothetical protein
MPKAKGGNPEWIEWLQELKDKYDAGDKPGDEHRAQATGKVRAAAGALLPDSPDPVAQAITALKGCGIYLSSPTKASQLKHIGPVTIKYLQRREKQYREEQGLPLLHCTPAAVHPRLTASSSFPADSDEEPPRKQKKDKTAAKKKDAPKKKKAAVESHQFNYDDDSSDVEAASKSKGKEKAPAKGGRLDEDSSDHGAPPPSSKQGKEKKYLPRRETGAHAILIAFVLASHERGTTKVRTLFSQAAYSELFLSAVCSRSGRDTDACGALQ